MVIWWWQRREGGNASSARSRTLTRKTFVTSVSLHAGLAVHRGRRAGLASTATPLESTATSSS